MRRGTLDSIAPGTFIARPIVDEAGRVLLNAGIALTDRYLSTLADKGFRHLFVRDVAPPSGGQASVPIAPDSHVNAVAAVSEAFKTVHRELGGGKQKRLTEHMQWCVSHAAEDLGVSDGPIQAVVQKADALLADFEGGGRFLGPIVQHVHEGTFGEHAARVAEWSLALGGVCGLNPRNLRQLTAGALLHDIGKAFSPAETGSDTAIVYHTTLGFALLRACDPKERLVQHVAYEHHEFQDGTGLPRGLEGSNQVERDRAAPTVATLVGEIAAIANAFDHLITGSAAKPLPVDWAMEVLRGHSGSRYNRELVKRFSQVIPPYPLGEDVIVDAEGFRGCTAVVRAINPRHAARPSVMVYLDANGKPCEPVELDLLNNSTVSIRCAPFR